MSLLFIYSFNEALANSPKNSSPTFMIIFYTNIAEPHKVMKLKVHGITWTTVRLSWEPGFHGIQIPMTSSFSKLRNLTMAPVDEIRLALEALYNQQQQRIAGAQQFTIRLVDYGYKEQMVGLVNQSQLAGSWSELSPSGEEAVRGRHQIRLRIGSSYQVNLTGKLKCVQVFSLFDDVRPLYQYF